MTVINAMRFNDKSGGMVSDSQGGTETRKYDFFDKIATLGDRLIIGGTGSSGILNEASQKLARSYDKDKSLYENATLLSGILNESYHGSIDQQMKTRFGFGTKEFNAGRLVDGTPIGQHLMPEANELFQGRDQYAKDMKGNLFVVIGKDRDGCRIYVVPVANSPVLWPVQYASFGSGQDESDNVLHDFMKSIPRSDRNDISFVDGMASLIRATNRSSEINQGVGGTPSIAYFNKDKMVMLGEEESLLATGIVKVCDRGLITRKDATASLERLLSNQEDYSKIKDSVFWNQQNSREIMEFLAGYRTKVANRE